MHLKPNAKPFACYVPRKIAHPLVPKVKAELDRMEKLGVIFKLISQQSGILAWLLCQSAMINSEFVLIH